eukprot:6156158-Prymnesium_polylepis.1
MEWMNDVQQSVALKIAEHVSRQVFHPGNQVHTQTNAFVPSGSPAAAGDLGQDLFWILEGEAELVACQVE